MMLKLQARNIPEDLYQRVTAAAARNERSLEGEVRHALAAAYPAPGSEVLSLRQQWQLDTARRLRQLTAQLHADHFWGRRGPGTLTQLARHIGEASPARLLDWMEGASALPFEEADKIAEFTGCSRDWLLDGTLDPFRIPDIGIPDDYEAFFTPEARSGWRFYLTRFADGQLLCIRHDSDKMLWSAGYMGGRFYLQDGMGSGGTGNLRRFLQYLKTNRLQHKIQSYDTRETSEDMGLHHPSYHAGNNRAARETSWLPQLLQGILPEHWAADASDLRYMLDQVRDTPDSSAP